MHKDEAVNTESQIPNANDPKVQAALKLLRMGIATSANKLLDMGYDKETVLVAFSIYESNSYSTGDSLKQRLSSIQQDFSSSTTSPIPLRVPSNSPVRYASPVLTVRSSEVQNASGEVKDDLEPNSISIINAEELYQYLMQPALELQKCKIQFLEFIQKTCLKKFQNLSDQDLKIEIKELTKHYVILFVKYKNSKQLNKPHIYNSTEDMLAMGFALNTLEEAQAEFKKQQEANKTIERMFLYMTDPIMVRLLEKSFSPLPKEFLRSINETLEAFNARIHALVVEYATNKHLLNQYKINTALFMPLLSVDAESEKQYKFKRMFDFMTNENANPNLKKTLDNLFNKAAQDLAKLQITKENFKENLPELIEKFLENKLSKDFEELSSALFIEVEFQININDLKLQRENFDFTNTEINKSTGRTRDKSSISN